MIPKTLTLRLIPSAGALLADLFEGQNEFNTYSGLVIDLICHGQLMIGDLATAREENETFRDNIALLLRENKLMQDQLKSIVHGVNTLGVIDTDLTDHVQSSMQAYL
jgi:hypothetical protein